MKPLSVEKPYACSSFQLSLAFLKLENYYLILQTKLGETSSNWSPGGGGVTKIKALLFLEQNIKTNREGTNAQNIFNYTLYV